MVDGQRHYDLSEIQSFIVVLQTKEDKKGEKGMEKEIRRKAVFSSQLRPWNVSFTSYFLLILRVFPELKCQPFSN
jgi:hypothetical protein